MIAGWSGQTGLTGEAAGVVKPEATLERGEGAEVLAAGLDVDGAAATHALAATRLAEREADVADGVEEGEFRPGGP